MFESSENAPVHAKQKSHSFATLAEILRPHYQDMYINVYGCLSLENYVVPGKETPTEICSEWSGQTLA